MVGLSLFLVVVVVAVGVVVWRTQHDSTYHAPLDGRPVPHVDQAGATSLLDDLQSAVRRDDVTSGASLGATRLGVTAAVMGLSTTVILEPNPNDQAPMTNQ